MTSARDAVLARVRGATAGAAAAAVHRGYRTGNDEPPSVALLVDRLLDYRATVHRASPSDVAAVLARVAQGRVVVPTGVPDAWVAGIDSVRDAPPLSAAALDGVDAVLTTCSLAIAETGTIVLDGGEGQGRRALTLIPDHHVVVVRVEQVVASVPQALAALTPRSPQTWISGPSATSDIELQRVEGVHGPRRLDVVLLGDS